VTAVRNKGLEYARMFWNILEQLGDSGGSFNTKAVEGGAVVVTVGMLKVLAIISTMWLIIELRVLAIMIEFILSFLFLDAHLELEAILYYAPTFHMESMWNRFIPCGIHVESME